jgi:hypothetical protein
MNKKVIIYIALLALVLLGGTALGQGSADFGLWWNAITSGGGHSASASYVVDGSIAQPVLGTSSSAGYRVSGGFWYGFVAAGAPPPGVPRLYLPALTRNT